MLPARTGLPCNSQAPCPPRDWLLLPETTPGPVPPSPSPGGPRGRTLHAATADGDDTTCAATKTTGEVSLRAAWPYLIFSESILKGVNPGKVSSYFAHCALLYSGLLHGAGFSLKGHRPRMCWGGGGGFHCVMFLNYKHSWATPRSPL